MGLFSRKPKIVKEISGTAWGHMVSEHGIDVDTLSKEMRCVEKKGTLDGGQEVTFTRVFKPEEAEKKGVEIEGWDTFDKHPDLLHYEGYVTWHDAHLKRV